MKNVPLYKPSIGIEELTQIKEVLNNKNEISKVVEFEESIKKFIGTSYAIAVCNETAALHLALSAINLKRGDKILISVNSFVNIPEVIRHFDAEPIFIDIDMDDMNMDLKKFEKVLSQNQSKKLKGAIVSFVAGQTTNMDKLYEIAKTYGIILIEDATNALGATFNGKPIGSLQADMTIFSTNPSNGEFAVSRNGFIVTKNENIASRAKLLRTNAIQTTYDEHGNLDYIYDLVDIGHKYDMSELDAAFGLSQLKKTEEFIKKRKKIAIIYENRLKGLKHIQTLMHKEEHIFTQYIIKVSKNRDVFARALKEEGISTGLHYIPLHLLNYYKNKYNLKITTFGTALSSYQQILSLPMYPSLSEEEVNYVCDTIIKLEKSWI